MNCICYSFLVVYHCFVCCTPFLVQARVLTGSSAAGGACVDVKGVRYRIQA